MSRQHYWHYLLNEAGEPIASANISVFQAGTTTALYVYTAESGGTPSNTVPQITTDTDGYFEFWVADSDDTSYGYSGIKIKIQWEKTGVIDTDSIDNIDFFGKKANVYSLSVAQTSWAADDGQYSYDVTHNLNTEYPIAAVYGDSSTLSEPITAGIISLTQTKIYRETNVACKVVLIG